MNIWLCEKDYRNQQRLYGMEFEIKSVPNNFNKLCIICEARADYLVSGIPSLLGMPMFLDDTIGGVDIVFGSPLI